MSINQARIKIVLVFCNKMMEQYFEGLEDVVGVAPTGDAPTTSEWPTI